MRRWRKTGGAVRHLFEHLCSTAAKNNRVQSASGSGLHNQDMGSSQVMERGQGQAGAAQSVRRHMAPGGLSAPKPPPPTLEIPPT